MPLRDHFHPPLSDVRSWDGLHGQWPAMIVIELSKRLPPRYIASPHVHLGVGFEIDVAALDEEQTPASSVGIGSSRGGTAIAWAPPEPTLALDTDVPWQDEYEVRVFDTERSRLVAAVEIVSPANKDRPEHRRAFIAKCAALLQQGVCVSIVDLVTSRRANLYSDLLEMLGESDPSFSPEPSPLYAVTCRWRPGRLDADFWKLETWAHALAIKSALPTLPLWVSADLAMPLELEQTYEETCRILRITQA